mmetsp:Transcript_116058/g.323274  ORF Transcript_116058/g.323274 Transcript_116058/m.323274 type:complete len:246 (+) Transcript_116058:71-808(+)
MPKHQRSRGIFLLVLAFPSVAARCLNFLHIPKTGGTSIENELQRAKSHLPKYMAKHGWGKFDTSLRCERPADRHCRWTGRDGGGKCHFWHVPPSTDPLLQRSYARCDTFCVVRHPVDRLISQWQFIHRRDPCDLAGFVSWVSEELTAFEMNPARADCHLVAQADFVFSTDGSRICQHLIRYENLTAEFDALMRRFELKIRLRRKDWHHKKCNLSQHLPQSTQARIKKAYTRDFEAFAYPQTGMTL